MARTYYCWRCRLDVPMLDEEEWAQIHPLLNADIEQIKAYRAKTNVDLRTALNTLRHRACERYRELTGFEEQNPNALWHHRLSVHGPECDECGHLLRTPQASFCANCGKRRSETGA